MENKVLMPRLGVNDDKLFLSKYLVKNGQQVDAKTKIAVIESAKETSELVSGFDGYISLIAKENSDVSVGAVVAVVSDVAPQESFEDKEESVDNLKITEKAKALVTKYNIDISLLPKDRLIKEKDVMPLISEPYTISEIKTNKVLIYGGGDLSKMVIDTLKAKHEYELYGVIDNNYPEKKDVLGIPVIGNDDNLNDLLKQGYNKIFNAVGFKNKAHYRKPTYLMLKEKGFELINIIHKTAMIEDNVKMGEGNLVCAGAIIGSDVKIGSNCIINAGSIISHDCIISDHCHIASGAVLAGSVIVGENTLIGQNCSINISVKIGKNVVIMNGCSVFKDVKDGEIVTLNQ